MHVSATIGSSLSKSAGCRPALRIARHRAVIGIYDGLEQAHSSQPIVSRAPFGPAHEEVDQRAEERAGR